MSISRQISARSWPNFSERDGSMIGFKIAPCGGVLRDKNAKLNCFIMSAEFKKKTELNCFIMSDEFKMKTDEYALQRIKSNARKIQVIIINYPCDGARCIMITREKLGSKPRIKTPHHKQGLNQIRRQLKVVQYNSHMAAQSRENKTLTDPYVQKSITRQFDKRHSRIFKSICLFHN
ncbi:unnamed protein product [Sphenostylis stenocarpa]|uniref:Uncharacterized protein n=1 Tax=Sphenostylis stenocarpa TaxID=92480 RepID=A0AA86RXR4_9FABA|nr:unnamed protein product [Sphenostylis stenocarpa]